MFARTTTAKTFLVEIEKRFFKNERVGMSTLLINLILAKYKVRKRKKDRDAIYIQHLKK